MTLTKTLTHWYSIHKRDMPWRNTNDPYRIWLSEVILQQTQIKQGLPYYEAFVTVFPTVFDLAKAPEEEVLKLWQGLGYYSRARNLHATAKHLALNLDGEFPNDYDGLIKLKGIGDYTASAIGSICFGLPTAVVDGNVYRVLARFFGIQTPINSSQGSKQFKKLAQELLNKENPGDHNQAIMEFGALQCKPSNPDCTVCPLQDNCKAFNEGMISQLPVKLKTTKIHKKHFNYIVLLSRERQTKIEQRTGQGIWQNLYQFPLIESDRNLSKNGLKNRNDFQQLVNGDILDMKLFNSKVIVHKLSHQHLHTKFWIVKVKNIKEEAIPVSTLEKYPVPILIGNFIEAFHFSQS